MALSALKSGRLTMLFDDANGMLRDIYFEESEIVRSIYAAVRDRDWNSIPYSIQEMKVEDFEDSFSIRWLALCSSGDVHFEWNGLITGSAEGIVRYEFQGTALRPFLKNRIGLCVLHPSRAAEGCACTVEQTDGAMIEGVFPSWISPHQPFRNIRSITHRFGENRWAKVTMEGDTFEMEDQRNWTDASFKTYSTPLELPFPVRMEKGALVDQSVQIELVENHGIAPSAFQSKVSVPELAIPKVAIDWKSGRKRPAIGLQIGEWNHAKSEGVIERLRSIGPDHLRVDLRWSDPSWQTNLENAISIASDVRTKLEIAFHVPHFEQTHWTKCRSLLEKSGIPVARWLVFHSKEKATSSTLIDEAIPWLRSMDGSIPIAIGTDAYFAELNRNRPRRTSGLLVSYSINPQVHATDSRSIRETLEALADTVDSAVHYFGSSVVISPVTLKPRFNPNATSGPASIEDQLREAIDPRQGEGFAAAWLAGVIAVLANHAKVHSLTLYEVAGPRGIMDCDARAYPTASFMEQLMRCDRIYPMHCTQLRDILGFGFENAKGERSLLVANLTDVRSEVEIEYDSGCSSRVKVDAESIRVLPLEGLLHE